MKTVYIGIDSANMGVYRNEMKTVCIDVAGKKEEFGSKFKLHDTVAYNGIAYQVMNIQKNVKTIETLSDSGSRTIVDNIQYFYNLGYDSKVRCRRIPESEIEHPCDAIHNYLLNIFNGE